MTDLHEQSTSKRHREAERRVRRAGYKAGGRVHSDVAEDETEDKEIAATAVHKHERNMHKGERETRLRRGGKVDGEAAPQRLDRRARGGRTKGLTVVIHNEPMHPAEKQQAAQMGAQQGMKIGAAMGARQAAARMGAMGGGAPPSPGAAPGRLPIAGPGMPGTPPGGMPTAGPPRPPYADGGRVHVSEHTRRRAGGAV